MLRLDGTLSPGPSTFVGEMASFTAIVPSLPTVNLGAGGTSLPPPPPGPGPPASGGSGSAGVAGGAPPPPAPAPLPPAAGLDADSPGSGLAGLPRFLAGSFSAVLSPVLLPWLSAGAPFSLALGSSPSVSSPSACSSCCSVGVG